MKKQSKKILIGSLAAAVVIAGAIVLYKKFTPKPAEKLSASGKNCGDGSVWDESIGGCRMETQADIIARHTAKK
jgi:hypothetical protein